MSEHDVGKPIKGDISEENIKDNSLIEGHVNMSSSSSSSSSSSTPIINGPVDAVMGRHILAGIEGQMPEFYEFFLRGNNKTYIRTESLKRLQGETQTSIKHLTEKGSALPETIINTLISLENYKDKSSTFNYFGAFIGSFIHFRQRHYDENNSPEKILFDKNSQQQSLNDRRNKIIQQTDLLASRLSGYLAQTFALLHQAQQTDLSPWSEVETLARKTLIAELLPVSYDKFDLSERLIQETRAMLYGNTLANMKMNNLTHAATWEERQRREKGSVSSSTATDRIDNNVAHGYEDFLFDLEGGLTDTSDNESGMSGAPMSNQLALLLQGITLTVNAASVLQQSGRYAAVPDEDMRFIDRIAGSGEKMFALVSALKPVVNSAAPTAHTLNDVPEESVAKQASVYFYHLDRQLSVSSSRLFQLISAPVMRLFRLETAVFAKTRDQLKNSLGMHTLTTAEKSAVLQAVVIVKNLLQQTGANIQRVQLAAEPLSAALRYRAALEALLKKGITPVLDSELARQRDVWQKTTVQQKADLEAFIQQKRILLHQEDSDALERLLANVLDIDGANLMSAGLLNDIFSELKGYIRFITKAGKEIASTPDYLTKTKVEYTDLSTRLAPLLFQTKKVQSLLNMYVSEWTGREPGSFSRSGMLARGIAAWHQERRKEWLENIASTEQADAEKQYDEAFVTLIKPYLPILAKQHDAGGEVLLQRIKTEMANAAAGEIIYPTTMAEMLSNQKTMTEALQHSVIRSLIRQGIQAIFGSATLVPSLATLPVRILIRSLLTGARVAYMSHKGKQAVPLGEGSAKLEARQFGRNAFAQAGAKTALGAVKPVQSAVGIAFVLYEIYQGETKDAVRRLARELPVEQGFESIRALARKFREMQSEAEREETRRAIQRMIGELEQDSFTDLDAYDELSRIADGDDPELATLAKKLQAFPASRWIRMRRSSKPGSHYDRATRIINLGSDASDKQLMHEVAHAFSAHQLVAGRENPDSPLGQHVRELEQLRMKARDAYIRMGGNDPDTRYFLGIDMNGNASAKGAELEEFVAGLYSGNPEFIEFLRAIDAQGNSLLSRVIEGLCLLLGLDQELESAFTHAMGLSDTIMGTELASGEGEADGVLNFKLGFSNRGSTTQTSHQTPQTAPSQESIWGRMTTVPKGNDRTNFVAWLARKSQNDRNSWIAQSRLNAAARIDLGIYLAERHFIYDHMVSGKRYFSWVREFKGWPANFQNDNRIVGIFRDARVDAKFPPGKRLRFELKDKNGNILFEKTYYPQGRGNNANDPLVWHVNILRQIERDMRMQPKGKRIAIHHLTNSKSANPGVVSGITGSKQENVFVTETGSSVSSANFQFVDAESPVANSNLAKGDMSDYAALNQYLINKDDISIDEKKEKFINTMIVANTADDDEVKSINDLLVVVYEANMEWKIVTLDEYLTKPEYLDAKYSMVVISKPTNMDTWAFDATSISKSYPQLQQLFQSEHFRQKYGQFMLNEVDGPEQDVYDENNKPREHVQDRARWKSSGQNLSTHTTRDLTFGEKIVVSVYKEGGLVEYITFSIPREYLKKEVWPGYIALRINDSMKSVRIGETDITDSSRGIHPQPDGNNTIWTRDGETVKLAITRDGSAAIHPSSNNRPWQVPDEETWSETPPVLNLPTIPESDERLVLWVEDRRTGHVVEWIDIPPTNANTYKECAESINSRASHIRVGELNNGDIKPREGPGNIIWVDNENYVVKYSLAPVSFYDANKQLIQKYQLLTLMEGDAEKTKSQFDGSESNPFDAIPRNKLIQIINLSPENVRVERNRIFQELERLKIQPEPIENIVEIKEIKELIREASKFKIDSYINPPARSNASVLNYAKINAIRFMLHKYPDLASSNINPSASDSEGDLLKILNEIYPVMTEEQKEEYSFINALYWNVSSATDLAKAISTKLNNNLDVLSLRKEIMDSYYQHLSANNNWHGPGANAIMPRSKFDSDGAYYQQFNYYTNTGESLKDGVTEDESSEEQDVIDDKATNSDVKTQVHLDDAILKVVWKKGIRITKSDLDKKYSVRFKTTAAVAVGDRTVPEITYTSKLYTLRDILLGNMYRDESLGIMSHVVVEDISGIDGINKSNLDGITKDIDQELRGEVENLKLSSKFKASVKSAYDKVLAGVLIEILKSNQSSEIIDIINKYIDGTIKLETVSVRKYGILSSTKYEVPGVVALRGPNRAILISLEKGTYRNIINSNEPINVRSHVEGFINEHLSRYDYEREEYSQGRTRWTWSFMYGGKADISNKDKIFERSFDRVMRRMLADFDYYTYNPQERDKERMIGHAKQLLLAVSAISGVVTMVAGTGTVAAAALATGLAAEAAEIVLSAEQMSSADRGDKYLDAYTDVFVGTILLSTFGVSDLNDLVRIAAKSRGEFTAAAKSVLKIANELKEGGSAKSLLKEATDLKKASDHAKRVIDEQLDNGVINQARHKELTDSVSERNAGITTLSPTIQSPAVPQPYVPSQWTAGTPQPSPSGMTNLNYQVDSNGPWRHVYPSGDKADTLTLFNHGKYFSSKPTTEVPKGIKIEFVTPHGSAASLPGERSFMHNEIMPFSTVDHKKFNISSYRDPQKTEPVPLTEIRDKILGPGKKPKVSDDEKRVLATGTEKKGSIINYVNLPFKPEKGTGNYVESDFVRFTEKNRVAQNSTNHTEIKEGLNIPSSQSFTPAEKTDFLFLDKDGAPGLTSQALEIAKEKGYKKVRLLHCRVERGQETNAVVYHINPHIPKDAGSLAGSGEQLYTVEFDLENNTMRIIPMTPVAGVANASDIDVEETASEN